ncbi:MAG: N-acetylmuramic acid 6-phosphate etherase [Terracidiphilus sp.]
MKMQVRELTTERRNRATENLDRMGSLELVTAMNREDAVVPRAVARVLPEVARAVDLVADHLARGGRLIYVGSGTSGRIGALDASECSPTFGVSAKMVQFVIAGGERALVRATEASEDSTAMGRKDMAGRRPGKRDVVVGLAASGYTPYTISALEYARSKGAATIAIAFNRNSAIGKIADLSIETEVGPEVLAGSSRLKAGTAEKLICNMLTTGAMTRLGYVYSNLMVNLRLTNRKLMQRGITILQELTGAGRDEAAAILEKAGRSVPLALVMLQTGASKAESARRLRRAKGNVRKAIEG